MKPVDKIRSDILNYRVAVASAAVSAQYTRAPETFERTRRRTLENWKTDAELHLFHLAQALSLESPRLFTDYIAWTKIVLGQRGLITSDFVFHLTCIADALERILPEASAKAAGAVVRTTIAELPEMPEDICTFLEEDAPMTPLARQYLEALRQGQHHAASQLILGAVERGTPVRDIYLGVFEPVQREIGRLWQLNQLSVAQEHSGSATTQRIMSQLYPKVFSPGNNDRTILATSVEGEQHAIGARMVADFFEMAGWHTHYLGADTPIADIIAAAVEHRTDVLALSASMLPHIEAVRVMIASARERADCAGMKIIVGGSLFNQNPDLWRQIGADGTAPNALEAVELGNRIVGDVAG